MSLLVIGSSSRVAQGLIRQLYSSGKYEKIVAADPFSSYWGIQRYTRFLDTLKDTTSTTKLSDAKISERSDLEALVNKSSDVLYVTHDYYANAPSKLNFLRQTAKITKNSKGVRRFVAVTPVELDNYNEEHLNVSEESEKEALQLNDKAVIVKSDVTFGTDSTVVNRILSKLVNRESLTFSPIGGGPAPIHSADLATGVQKLLLESTQTGVKYLAQGQQRIDWATFLRVLESAAYLPHSQNLLEKVVSPTHSHIVSEFLYSREYINLAQLVNKYHPPNHVGTEDFSKLVGTTQDFQSFYSSNKLDFSTFVDKSSLAKQWVQARLY